MPQIERAARTGAVDFEARTIEVIATPYGEEIEVMHNGKVLREVFERGAFRDIDPTTQHITVNRDHDNGRAVGKTIGMQEDQRGAIALARISRTPLGDETLTLADDGVLLASIHGGVAPSGMEIRNGLRRIFRLAALDHIALLPNAAYRGAKVLAVRSADEFDEDDDLKPNLESVLAIAGMSDLLRGRSNALWRGREQHNG